MEETTVEMNEPCPFCGSMTAFERVGYIREFEGEKMGATFSIVCTNCEASTDAYQYLENARMAWNSGRVIR